MSRHRMRQKGSFQGESSLALVTGNIGAFKIHILNIPILHATISTWKAATYGKSDKTPQCH